MYNRVPKCGSRSMKERLEAYGKQGNYSFSEIPNLPHRVSPRQQMKTVYYVLKNKTKPRHAWVAHKYFFDHVGNYNGQLVWMNVLRDPVERFISDFYWLRRGTDANRLMLQITRGSFEEEENLDLNKCTPEGHPSCTWTAWPPGELQLTYLCGTNESCVQRGNKWALQRAKYNIAKYYGVVGILEELPLSLAVMEAYIPVFFKIHKRIRASSIATHARNSDVKKPVSNVTRNILRNNLKEDYELYKYAQQRLHLQAAAAGIDAKANVYKRL
ncbi:hypothetical protein SK128_007320 [Halocaridina rubra]|uniref:Sulfotransferase n=1 Tax=Halocaridina rubra TaxID=373956 RepID=A0AAN8XAU1_HALRR